MLGTSMTFGEWVEFRRLMNSVASETVREHEDISDDVLREDRSSRGALEILRECGWELSETNLDYLVRRGAVAPEKLGKNLTWSPADLDTLRAHLESVKWERSDYAEICHRVHGRLIDFWRALTAASLSEGAKHGFRGGRVDVTNISKYRLTITPRGFGKEVAEFSFELREDFLRERREMMAEREGGAE